MEARYESSIPWSPERPDILVVCCSDGRFHAQVFDFIHERVSDRSDLYVVAGGPVVIDPWASSFDEARAFDSSLRLFEQFHDLQQACLIAHEGCAYYRERHPGTDVAALESRQVRDLRRGAELLRERFPRLSVQLVYARLVAGHVRFEVVPSGPSLETHVLT